jgi:hypothetical protein
MDQGRETQDAFPAGPKGETYTSNGHTGMDALGLRGEWTAQRNGFTPARDMCMCAHQLFGKIHFLQKRLVPRIVHYILER